MIPKTWVGKPAWDRGSRLERAQQFRDYLNMLHKHANGGVVSMQNMWDLCCVHEGPCAVWHLSSLLAGNPSFQTYCDFWFLPKISFCLKYLSILHKCSCGPSHVSVITCEISWSIGVPFACLLNCKLLESTTLFLCFWCIKCTFQRMLAQRWLFRFCFFCCSTCFTYNVNYFRLEIDFLIMLTNQSHENVFCRFHAAYRTWIYILESDSQGSQTICFPNHEMSCVLMKHLSHPNLMITWNCSS